MTIWSLFPFHLGIIVFHNGENLIIAATIHQMDEESSITSDVKNYKRLLQASKKIFDVGFSELAHVPFLTVCQ